MKFDREIRTNYSNLKSNRGELRFCSKSFFFARARKRYFRNVMKLLIKELSNQETPFDQTFPSCLRSLRG